MSDKDNERLRKTTIAFLKDFAEQGYENAVECIDWLEKQSESDETKTKIFLINKGYPIDSNGIFPTYEELYNIIKEGFENQATPQIRTGVEWVNTIDDACDKRYSEEYADGEYCHEQSFRWGFQEGVDWLEKYDTKDGQVILPKFTFDDVLALQRVMETVKKVQEDETLYEQLQSLYNRLYDAYCINK